MSKPQRTIEADDSRILAEVMNGDNHHPRGRRLIGSVRTIDVDQVLKGRSSAAHAKRIGTSARQVEKARTILRWAEPEVIHAVLNGEMTITAAYPLAIAEKLAKLAAKGVASPRSIVEGFVSIVSRKAIAKGSVCVFLSSDEVATIVLVAQSFHDQGLFGDVSKIHLEALFGPLEGSRRGAS